MIINHRNPKFLNSYILRALRVVLKKSFKDSLGEDYSDTNLYPFYRKHLLKDRNKRRFSFEN